MKIFNLVGIFFLTFTSLMAQDYKPYKSGGSKDSDKVTNQDNSADGFFDNYVNLYNGDPNVAIIEKNKETKLEQEKLLKEKEAILMTLDSLAIATNKEERKISNLKNEIAKESTVTKRPSKRSKPQDDDYEIVYERKIVRRTK